jgi:hypothetical protein
MTIASANMHGVWSEIATVGAIIGILFACFAVTVRQDWRRRRP